MIKSQGVLSANAVFFSFQTYLCWLWKNGSISASSVHSPVFQNDSAFPDVALHTLVFDFCLDATGKVSFWWLSQCTPYINSAQLNVAGSPSHASSTFLQLPYAVIWEVYFASQPTRHAVLSQSFLSDLLSTSSFPFHNFIIAFWAEEIQSWIHFDILIHYSFIPKNRTLFKMVTKTECKSP